MLCWRALCNEAQCTMSWAESMPGMQVQQQVPDVRHLFRLCRCSNDDTDLLDLHVCRCQAAGMKCANGGAVGL